MGMKLSLYTYLFCKNGIYYLYNSQTGFLSEIEPVLYEHLYNQDFEEIDKDTLDLLKTKEIIKEDAHLYDYYYCSHLKFLKDIGNEDSLSLAIAPTTGCIFACPYCFEGKKADKRMAKEVIDNLVLFINSFYKAKKLFINWYGGEPLCAFGIIKDIVSRIQNECQIAIASQSMVTNGYLINDEVISFMKENHFKKIQITFDGIEENHNKTRCLKSNSMPTFSTIMSNVEKLAREMPSDFKISLRININKDNEHDYAAMHKLIKKKFSLFGNVGTYPGFIRELNKEGNRICHKSIFGRSRYDFYKTIREENVGVNLYPKIQSKKTCMICRKNAYIIGPEGELYKCWNDFNSPDRIIGYIDEKKITNPSLMGQYAYDATIYGDPKCKECKLFPVCDGGCGYLRHKNVFEGKKYNLCTFLSDDSILEECLLAKAVEKSEEAVRAF